MGEVAEMMLDGTLCQVCGAIMDDMVPPASWFKKQKEAKKKGIELAYDKKPPGYPRICKDCDGE